MQGSQSAPFPMQNSIFFPDLDTKLPYLTPWEKIEK